MIFFFLFPFFTEPADMKTLYKWSSICLRKKRDGWVIPSANLPKRYKFVKMVKKKKKNRLRWFTHRFTESIWPKRQKGNPSGKEEDKGVCPPMLICPQRRTGGRRKSSRGCRDVFECARVLSNVNLTKGEQREEGGGEEVWEGRTDGHV